ncbi:Gfo/Idh/MocA family protein [Georgenia sunbinii]|uniref:Gfo/Idh/MocA family protein n=1 Tax=Georgenia sunbinii TaxID=3117728 RepID=UPI002F25F5D2
MRIGVAGCGYVFDSYMSSWANHPALELVGVTDRDASQLERASRHFAVPSYASVEEMLADPDVDMVLNLTSIQSHYEVTRAALAAGKHVYSEKPLTTDMAQALELVALAESQGRHLACAPSNALSATSQTMWKVVADGLVGDVRLVYAELDDNPIYLMAPENWRSVSGAPWPYLREYEAGCTWEHVSYHLAWMCAIFGPVRSVTAFSKLTLPDKTDRPLSPADTPDFSVACLDFESGVVGRVTCSIGAPYDHRMRVVGNRGMVHSDNPWHDECPVFLEPFTTLSLNARKTRAVRSSRFLQRLFGVGGRRVPLVRTPPPGSDEVVDALGPRRWWSPRDALRRIRLDQLGHQDKCIGIAELADAIEHGRAPFPGHAFMLHLTELTLAIQSAGADGASHRVMNRFEPWPLPVASSRSGPDYQRYVRRSTLDRLSAGLLHKMHRHGVKDDSSGPKQR